MVIVGDGGTFRSPGATAADSGAPRIRSVGQMATTSTPAATRNRPARMDAACADAQRSRTSTTIGSASGRPRSSTGRTRSRATASVRTTLRPSMRCVPKPVSTASPMAMPAIRATVTPALAMPDMSWPRDSRAAVDRGVTVSPKPSPNRASAASSTGSCVAWSEVPSTTMPAVASSRPPMASGTTRMPLSR